MLLIIFFGLIAKIALASADCDFGPLPLNDFNWTKFSVPRPWYFKLHDSKDFEDDIDCPIATYSSPEGDRSSVSSDIYDTRRKQHIILPGYARNWKSNGCFEQHHTVSLWNGRCCMLAVVYDRYFIGRFCPLGSNETSVYVAYRSKNPDEQTVKDVMKDLQQNNIDANQLMEFNMYHCQQEESSTAGESSTETLV